MSNLFRSPPPPPPPPKPEKPPPIPNMNSPAVLAGQRAAMADQVGLAGRRSTILTNSTTRPSGDYSGRTLG